MIFRQFSEFSKKITLKNFGFLGTLVLPVFDDQLQPISIQAALTMDGMYVRDLAHERAVWDDYATKTGICVQSMHFWPSNYAFTRQDAFNGIQEHCRKNNQTLCFLKKYYILLLFWKQFSFVCAQKINFVVKKLIIKFCNIFSYF